MTDTYSPSLFARLLGGIQWAFTTMVIVATIAVLYTTYLIDTHSGNIAFSYAQEATVALVIAFGIGYFWVGEHTKNRRQETNEIRQRIDYLFILWVGWPVVYVGLSQLLNLINIDLSNSVYLRHMAFGFGDVLFAIFVIYYSKAKIISRFIYS